MDDGTGREHEGRRREAAVPGVPMRYRTLEEGLIDQGFSVQPPPLPDGTSDAEAGQARAHEGPVAPADEGWRAEPDDPEEWALDDSDAPILEEALAERTYVRPGGEGPARASASDPGWTAGPPSPDPGAVDRAVPGAGRGVPAADRAAAASDRAVPAADRALPAAEPAVPAPRASPSTAAAPSSVSAVASPSAEVRPSSSSARAPRVPSEHPSPAPPPGLEDRVRALRIAPRP